MIPTDQLIRVSQHFLTQGLRLLQGHRLASTDHGHVVKLLEFMQPKEATHWLDIGCGFGEAAVLMNDIRQDLKFTLLNNNGFQLDYCPRCYRKVYADMEDIPLPDAVFDGCMFLYSLCHADNMGAALTEAARVTRTGGELFVYDYERIAGDNGLFSEKLFATALSFDTIKYVTGIAGWNVVDHANPIGDDTLFRTIYNNDAEYTRIFRELRPVLWKAIRV